MEREVAWNHYSEEEKKKVFEFAEEYRKFISACRLLDVSEGYILNGASSNSTNYLDKEFSELLKGCSSEKQRLIYDIAKVIAESDNNDD